MINLSKPFLLACISFALLNNAFASDAATRGTAIRIPVSIEANACQTDPEVRYLARGARFTLFLTDSGATVALNDGNQSSSVVRMSWRGTRIRPVPQRRLRGRVNYLVGRDPSKWCAEVPTFEAVRYKTISPGVDLVFRGAAHGIEYDVVIAPGTDPSTARLQFDGAALALNEGGELVLKSAGGVLTNHRPVIYQVIDGKRLNIAGGYKVDGNRVGFRIGPYDRRHELVIDPTLAYSTYLGGSDSDEAAAIAVDASGRAYITGSTHSADFPLKNPYQAKATEAAFVTKFWATGGGLIYSTYFGTGRGSGIAVDRYGSVYFTGITDATHTPGKIIGTIDPNTYQAFVAKLSPSGSRLVYSLMFGGINGAETSGLALDSTGHAYVTGNTQSANFPTTPGAYKTASAGGAFVVKVNSAGTDLTYATYLTDTFSASAGGIAVDASGRAYVTGSAVDGFPTTPGAFQPVQPNKVPCAPGDKMCVRTSVFVTKFNSSGSGLIYSTLIGGNLDDYGTAIALDRSGNAYVTGSAGSSNFPTTRGAYRRTRPTLQQITFVTKLNATGSVLTYSTYLGGSGGSSGNSIAVNSLGHAFVTGFAGTGFPLKNAIRTNGTIFVTKLWANGGGLHWSTRFGGSIPEAGAAVRLDSAGSAYITGSTQSKDFPTTKGAYRRTLRGMDDIFLFKITDSQ